MSKLFVMNFPMARSVKDLRFLLVGIKKNSKIYKRKKQIIDILCWSWKNSCRAACFICIQFSSFAYNLSTNDELYANYAICN